MCIESEERNKNSKCKSFFDWWLSTKSVIIHKDQKQNYIVQSMDETANINLCVKKVLDVLWVIWFSCNNIEIGAP